MPGGLAEDPALGGSRALGDSPRAAGGAVPHLPGQKVVTAALVPVTAPGYWPLESLGRMALLPWALNPEPQA